MSESSGGPPPRQLDALAWRAPTRGDLPAWAAALAAIEAVDRKGESEGEEDLADLIGLSYFDAEHDARLVWGPDHDVVAYATVLCMPSTRQNRVSLEAAVRPDWRGRGLGTALVEWQIARGLAVGAARDVELPGWLELLADEHDTGRTDLFTANGFTPLRYSLEMRRPLDAKIPEPFELSGLRLVPFDFRYDEAVRAAHNEAFVDHWGSTVLDQETWQTWVTGQHDFRADCSFIVFDGDEIAGYANNCIHPADWPGLGFTEGWTHQLGVRRPWRGRGVARALLGATMRAFAGEGLEFAALDVDAENPTGALRLYRGMGYEQQTCRVAWSRPLD